MRLFALPLLAFTLACGSTPPRVTQLLGGDTIEKGAPRVVAYRIDGSLRDASKPVEGPALHGYPVLGGPVDVDAASQAILRDVLLSDDTYLWDEAKACEFLPGVLIRYEAEATIDVLLCFSCDELEVFRNGEETGHEDFDPRRPDLVKVAKRLFPDDAAIRALKPKG